MNKTFVIILVVLLAGIGAVYVFGLPGLDKEDKSMETSWEETDTLSKQDLGFSLPYPSGLQGYVLIENNSEGAGNSTYTSRLYRTNEYQNIPEGSEPPPAISIEVFSKEDEEMLADWIRDNERANWHLAVNDTIDVETIGAASFVTYQWDGLYRADVYAHEQSGYVYLFSAEFSDTDSPLREDLQSMLASTTWSLPAGEEAPDRPPLQP